MYLKQLSHASYYTLNTWGSQRIVVGFELLDESEFFWGISLETKIRLEAITQGRCSIFTIAEWSLVRANFDTIVSWFREEEANEDVVITRIN